MFADDRCILNLFGANGTRLHQEPPVMGDAWLGCVDVPDQINRGGSYKIGRSGRDRWGSGREVSEAAGDRKSDPAFAAGSVLRARGDWFTPAHGGSSGDE